jgi:hypothetical protein
MDSGTGTLGMSPVLGTAHGAASAPTAAPLDDDGLRAASAWLGAELDAEEAEDRTEARTNGWDDPKPIVWELRPVAPFDPDALLPNVLRDWIMDEAERMPCPPDFVAAAAIVTLGSLVGARCAIKPKARDSWLVVPNLWGGIVGDPSAKKSPAWGAALRPLDKLIAAAIEAHGSQDAEYKQAAMIHEARQDSIKYRLKRATRTGNGQPADIAAELAQVEEPQEPTLRRYKCNDSTVEKLGEILRDNPAGVLVLRDELVGLIANWEREGREGDRAFFLEAWNGNQSFDVDRIGRGHVIIENLCLSIFGGIQPDKLVGYLEQATNALADDGMLQRFQLLVYPDHRTWEYRDREPDCGARDATYGVFEKLAAMDPVALGATPKDDQTKFPYFRLSTEAQELFIEWATDLHRNRIEAEESPIIRQHLAKYDKLFPALALVLHLVDCVHGNTGGPVSLAAAIRAAAWCEYLEGHARRCYGLLADAGLRAAQTLAGRIRRGALPDGFTARTVRLKGWKHLTEDGAIQTALDCLTEESWIRAKREPLVALAGGGRPTVRYEINPIIRPGG